MSWFSGNTNSDSKGDSSATEGPTQSRTPSIQNTALCGTVHPPSWPLSASSTPRPASSHWISLGFHQTGTGSPSRESGERRIHSPWRNPNVPPWHELPAALEPLPITICNPSWTNFWTCSGSWHRNYQWWRRNLWTCWGQPHGSSPDV